VNLLPVSSDDHLIEEQIDYYRRHALEYDEASRPPGDFLSEYRNELFAALDRFLPEGDVLEVASGTGPWTAEILRVGHRSKDRASLRSEEPNATTARASTCGICTPSWVRHVDRDRQWQPDGRTAGGEVSHGG
jgi:hypothetical protein